MKRPFQKITLTTTVMIASLGCGHRTLVVTDTIARPGSACSASAYVSNLDWAIFTNEINKAPVEFFLEDKTLGYAETDTLGRASIQLDQPVESRVSARTYLGEQSIESQGRIFLWDNDRTIIAIDLDETICLSKYLNLIWGDGLESPAIDGSVEGVNKLAEKYQILYFSARPRFMVERTRKWLDKHGFPAGPIMFAADLNGPFNQGPTKIRMLAEFRKAWPNTLIVIGDRYVDVECSVANDMLPVIVNPTKPIFRERAIVVPDWESLVAFFNSRDQILSDPQVLADALERGDLFEPHYARVPLQKPGTMTRVAAAHLQP